MSGKTKSTPLLKVWSLATNAIAAVVSSSRECCNWWTILKYLLVLLSFTLPLVYRFWCKKAPPSLPIDQNSLPAWCTSRILYASLGALLILPFLCCYTPSGDHESREGEHTPAVDHGSSQAPPVDPGSPQALSVDPGSPQAPSVDPGSPQAPSVDPGSSQAPSVDPTRAVTYEDFKAKGIEAAIIELGDGQNQMWFYFRKIRESKVGPLNAAIELVRKRISALQWERDSTRSAPNGEYPQFFVARCKGIAGCSSDSQLTFIYRRKNTTLEFKNIGSKSKKLIKMDSKTWCNWELVTGSNLEHFTIQQDADAKEDREKAYERFRSVGNG